MIVLAGGFAVAALVAVLVGLLLERRTPPAAPITNSLQVVVAARNLPTGEVVRDQDLKWQDWPQSSTFAGLITRKEGQRPGDAVNGRLIRPVAAGEPVLESALVKETSNAVADMLGEGMRAVAITVSAQTEAGGFVMPGDHVDVILTYRKTINMDGESDPRVREMVAMNFRSLASETILHNVRILATDQSPEKPVNNKKQGKVSRTVTVEVSERESRILALAPSLGTISLALRKPNDTTPDVPEPNIVTDERIIHITEEMYDEARKIRGSSGGNIVRVYSGFDVQDQTVAHP